MLKINNRKRKSINKKLIKFKLSKATNEVLLKFEDEIVSDSADNYTKMFNSSYYNDISAFKKEFGEKRQEEKKLTLKNKFKLKSRARVFSYLVKQEWDKRIVLSRNIIENAISYNKTKIYNTAENGWTKL